MTLDEAQGLWKNTELTAPSGDVHTVELCHVWSTPKMRIVPSTEVLLDVPISDIESFADDADALVGWSLATGPHLGEFVVKGEITDIGATLTGLDWQTLVVDISRESTDE